MTKSIEALVTDLLHAAVKVGAEKWISSNGEVATEDYEVDGVTYTDHICNCEVVNGESLRADFIAKANPAAVMILIAELEQAQQEKSHLEFRLKNVQDAFLAGDERALRVERRNAELEKRLRETEETLIAATDHIAELEARGSGMLAALENHEQFWSLREMELGSLSPEAVMVRDVGILAIRAAGGTVAGSD